MSKNFSLKSLSSYLTDNVRKIGVVHDEMKEIQIGFNSAYVEWKAEHDATLERLTEAVTDRIEQVGPDLQTLIEARLVEEKRIIAERCQELRTELVPETQTYADTALGEGQRLTEKLRELNPRLDEREEKLKEQRAANESELARLNEEIRRLSGCLGVVINFRKINKLDRQRQRVIGKLEAIQHELQEVRKEWQTSQHQIQEQQENLKAQWQEATLKAAQLQGELDYLEDETNRQALARKRAIRHVIDNLKEPIACPLEDTKEELDSMVQLNIQTDDYQEGLGSVSSMMSLLEGITEGFQRFDQSVQGLISEQKMHSSFLPELNISVPDGVLAFNEGWDSLRERVRDEQHLGEHPAEFINAILPVIEADLSEANIKAMFDGMGRALDQATQKWRG